MQGNPNIEAEAGSLSFPHIKEDASNSDLTHIRAELLIPSRSDPTKDAAVVISSNSKKIVFVGKQSDVPNKYAVCPMRVGPCAEHENSRIRSTRITYIGLINLY